MKSKGVTRLRRITTNQKEERLTFLKIGVKSLMIVERKLEFLTWKLKK